MKFMIPFLNDKKTTKGAYSSSTPSATKTTLKKRPSQSAKKRVVYFDKSDSDLESDENGYMRSKTKSFKKKANTTNSDSDSNEFELGPDADDEDKSIAHDTVLSEMESEDEEMMGLSLSHTVGTGLGVTFYCTNWSSPPLPPPPLQTQTHKYTGHPIAVVIDEEDEEATKSSTAAKSSAVTKSSAAIKSSVGMDKRKLTAKPSTTGVDVELTDKEKRAKNKKIKEEVLQKNHQI